MSTETKAVISSAAGLATLQLMVAGMFVALLIDIRVDMRELQKELRQEMREGFAALDIRVRNLEVIVGRHHDDFVPVVDTESAEANDAPVFVSAPPQQPQEAAPAEASAANLVAAQSQAAEAPGAGKVGEGKRRAANLNPSPLQPRAQVSP